MDSNVAYPVCLCEGFILEVQNIVSCRHLEDAYIQANIQIPLAGKCVGACVCTCICVCVCVDLHTCVFLCVPMYCDVLDEVCYFAQGISKCCAQSASRPHLEAPEAQTLVLPLAQGGSTSCWEPQGCGEVGSRLLLHTQEARKDFKNKLKLFNLQSHQAPLPYFSCVESETPSFDERAQLCVVHACTSTQHV